MPVSTPCRDEWLLRLLLSKKALDEDQVEAVRKSEGPYASAEILRLKLLTKDQIARTVMDQYGISYAEPDVSSIDKMAVSLVPERLCRKHSAVPIGLREEQIRLLMIHPLDIVALDEISAVTGRRAVPVFGFPDKIEELLGRAYSSDAAVADLLKKLPQETSVEWIEGGQNEGAADDNPDVIGAPVIQLANLLIARAIRMQASDVHIEHEESLTVVRYRIDGVLRNVMTIPKGIGEGPLVSRIKIMANLDVADRRRPQDGRAKLRVASQEVGLRVSTVPTAFGEKVVLRILDQRQTELSPKSLGFREELLERILKLSRMEKGMLLMTGPTGSGKTTTLYSLLKQLKSPDINVITIEDPIEYRLGGINQVQVNEKAGLTFASVLRSVLRQDPDVILVGEIRDRETADIAFQAALTGHMVFSTLHTNDSIATINRLIDMKVECFKMAPALVGIVSQRLVRRLCANCKTEDVPPPAVAALLRRAGLPETQFKGRGCEKCSATGLSGRIAISELLDLSDQAARDMISPNMDTAAFREKALGKGWLLPLANDALWHMAHGDIPLEEAAVFLEIPKAVASNGNSFPAQSGGLIQPPGPPLSFSDASPLPPAPPKVFPTAVSGRSILIVDDNLDNRLLVRDTIGSVEYRLTEAEDGLRALEEAARQKPDLILLDIMMPKMDGFAVLKKLRQTPGLEQLPIIILTAMSEAESQALALELGADDYLTKPFNPRVLRARVQALFRRHEVRETTS